MALSPPPKSINTVKEAVDSFFQINGHQEIVNEELWNMYRDSLESDRGSQQRADLYKSLVDLVKVMDDYLN